MRTLLRSEKNPAHARVRLHIRVEWRGERRGWGGSEKTTSTLATFEQRNLARWRESCMSERWRRRRVKEGRRRRASHQHVFLLFAFMQSFLPTVCRYFIPELNH